MGDNKGKRYVKVTIEFDGMTKVIECKGLTCVTLTEDNEDKNTRNCEFTHAIVGNMSTHDLMNMTQAVSDKLVKCLKQTIYESVVSKMIEDMED